MKNKSIENTIVKIVALTLLIGPVYLLLWFITQEANPNQWSAWLRALFGIYSLFVVMYTWLKKI